MENQPTLFVLPDSPKLPAVLGGTPRLKIAERKQVEFRSASLDDLIAEDHIVRLVWDFVNRLDMSNILGTIQSVEGSAGRPATDPKILLALWLYATLEGIVSARVIAEYCEEHIAYQWICGNVKTNHHTLSDFATKHGEEFDEFLTQSVAILMKQGSITMEEVAQDGMRVRACAGSSSFRKEEKLRVHYNKAKNYLASLREALKSDLTGGRSKKKAAELRAAEDRERRVKNALEELIKLKEKKQKEKHVVKKKREEALANARASTTDPEARRMKMPNGGYNPAYNVQFATTKKGRVIVGVDVNNQGNDTGLITQMIDQVLQRSGELPQRWLVDTGYAKYEEFTLIDRKYKGCNVYMAPKISGKLEIDPYKILPGDSEGIAAWRKRMATEEAKNIYRGRGSVAEFSNAQSRNKGLLQFLVRGLRKVKATAYRFALAHNMQRFFALRPA